MHNVVAIRAGVRAVPLPSRVKLAMDFLEPRVIDVGVDLCGCDARVAEHFLHLAKIGAPRDEMRREAVAHGVRANR